MVFFNDSCCNPIYDQNKHRSILRGQEKNLVKTVVRRVLTIMFV